MEKSYPRSFLMKKLEYLERELDEVSIDGSFGQMVLEEQIDEIKKELCQ